MNRHGIVAEEVVDADTVRQMALSRVVDSVADIPTDNHSSIPIDPNRSQSIANRSIMDPSISRPFDPSTNLSTIIVIVIIMNSLPLGAILWRHIVRQLCLEKVCLPSITAPLHDVFQCVLRSKAIHGHIVAIDLQSHLAWGYIVMAYIVMAEPPGMG